MCEAFMRTQSEQGFWRWKIVRLDAACSAVALFLLLGSANAGAQQSVAQSSGTAKQGGAAKQGSEAAQEKRAAESSGQAGTSRIDESLLVGLPLNGRSYSQLATLE